VKKLTAFLAAVVVVYGLAVTFAARADEMVHNAHAVIIAGHPEATRLGMSVLHAGGTAADALVTVSLSLNVAEPSNSGLGGKFVLTYYDAKTRDVTSVVAMDAAPLKIDVEQAISLPADQHRRGWHAALVPGLLAGLAQAHAKWGTLSWSALVKPAADLAEHGYPVSDLGASMLAEFSPKIDAEAARVYAPGGHTPRAGTTFRNPDLARTLRIVAEKGPDGFYKGDIADRLIAASVAAGGWFSPDDFHNYKARVLKPLSATYHGHTIYSGPPPTTGGTTLLTTLMCLSAMEEGGRSLRDTRPRDAAYIDTLARALQQVFPQVAREIGDTPDFAPRVAKIFDPRNIRAMASRAAKSDPHDPLDRQKESSLLPANWFDETERVASTTHLIIIDAKGNVACVTQSLGNHFGAAVVAPGTGFLLNDDLNNFSFQTPSSLNYIAPGRWPRSTVTPTIVLDQQRKPLLAIGSPGADRIPVAVLQVLVDVVDFNRPLRDAVTAPRFHLRKAATRSDAPNHIDLEKPVDDTAAAALEQRGWKLTKRDNHDFYFGSVNAALFAPDGTLTAVADRRRTNDAGGE